MQNHVKWIAAILNLMEDEARTWALPYLEDLAQGGSPFTGDYDNFMVAFNKRFAPHNSTKTARDVLKHIKQGKNSVAEYQARFDQFTSQTGWSNANHRTRFYDGLSEAIRQPDHNRLTHWNAHRTEESRSSPGSTNAPTYG